MLHVIIQNMKTLRTIISTNHSVVYPVNYSTLISIQPSCWTRRAGTCIHPPWITEKLKPLSERGIQEILKRTCNIHVHLKTLCWDFVMFVQRMFCNDKKWHFKQLAHKIRVRKRFCFILQFLFSASCNCWCLSIRMERCVSFFWNYERKLLLWTKWTYDSDLMSESIMLSFFATGIDWGLWFAGLL